MPLEALRMAPLTVYALQPLGERPPTVLTFKPSHGKVQEGTLAPYVQITHTPFLAVMDRGGDPPTTRANSHLMAMDTVKVQDLLLPTSLKVISYYSKRGQT